MGGIEYFANKEKGTVVAKIDNIQNDILAMLKKMFWSNAPLFNWNFLIKISDSFPTQVIGKAVCDEDDEFDLETGMYIARLRVIEKYQKMRIKAIERAEDVLWAEIYKTSTLFYTERDKLSGIQKEKDDFISDIELMGFLTE